MGDDLKDNRKSRYLFFIVFFLSLVVNPGALRAGDNNPELRGYIKSLASLTDFTGLDMKFTGSGSEDAPKHEAALINTLRLDLVWQSGGTAAAEVAYELVPRVQDANGSETFFSIRAANPLSYRAVDLGEKIRLSKEDSDFQLFQNLDRALLTLSPPFGDIYIGRQPVAFGSARVINPTDVLTSFAYTELNKEERVGVDAVRVRIPAGSMGEVDAGVVFGDDFDVKESAAFIRSRSYLLKTDIVPTVIIFKENLLLGMDVARSIGDAGYWFEGAYVFADVADDYESGQDYLRISTGLDYSFTEKLYAYIEYHFNGAGRTGADDYRDLILAGNKETAYQEGSVYLFGKHYIAPGFRYQITPLLSLSTGTLYNINDGSVLLFPDFQYSLSDNAVMEAGAFVGFGKGSEIVRNSDTGITDISAGSEFGLYPDTYFITAKWYF